jgi:hypothetical protein
VDALGAHQYAGCCTFKLLQDGAELPLPRAGRGEVRSAVVPWRRAWRGATVHSPTAEP